MRRTFAVIGWIFLGALAAGSSLGFYLYRANADRQWLGLKVSTLQEQNRQAQLDNERLTDQLSHKNDTANLEAARLRTLLQSCEERTSRLVHAVPLVKPDGRALRGWSDALSLSLGVSLKLPPGAQADDQINYFQAVTASRGASSTWLVITPYDQLREQELATDLTNTEAVSYSINGTLAGGIRGRSPSGTGVAYILRIGSDGAPSHLIWAQTNDQITASRVLDVLATLAFR